MPKLIVTATGYEVRGTIATTDRKVALSLFGILQAFETSVTKVEGNGHKNRDLLVEKGRNFRQSTVGK